MFSTFTELQASIIITEQLIPASMHSINVFFLLTGAIWPNCSINHTSFSVYLPDNMSQVQKYTPEAKTIRWSLKKRYLSSKGDQQHVIDCQEEAALSAQHTLVTLIYLLFQSSFANRSKIYQTKSHSPCKHPPPPPCSKLAGNMRLGTDFEPSPLWRVAGGQAGSAARSPARPQPAGQRSWGGAAHPGLHPPQLRFLLRTKGMRRAPLVWVQTAAQTEHHQGQERSHNPPRRQRNVQGLAKDTTCRLPPGPRGHHHPGQYTKVVRFGRCSYSTRFIPLAQN